MLPETFAAPNPLLPAGYDLLWSLMLAGIAALAVIAVFQVLRAKLTGLETVLWMLLIVVLPILGPIVWFVSARRLRAESSLSS